MINLFKLDGLVLKCFHNFKYSSMLSVYSNSSTTLSKFSQIDFKMSTLLVCLCFQFIIGASTEKALVFKVEHNVLDVSEDKLRDSSSHRLFACAAFTEKEKQFNEKNSFSGNGIFSRPSSEVKAALFNGTAMKDLCENPYQPAVVYDSMNDEYLIGYEVYDRTGGNLKICSFNSNIYGALQSVNPKNYTLSKKPEDYSIAARYSDRRHTKFRFYDDHSELVFCWAPVLSIHTPAYDKKWIHLRYQRVDDTKGECNDYGSWDKELEFIFSEQNQAENLKDIPSLLSLPGNSTEISCGQPFGCLEKYQIMPSWHFHSNSSKIASCVAMNIIPVWKSIANKQLKKVDRFIKFVASTFCRGGGHPSIYHEYEVELIFGVFDIMKSSYENSSDEPREIYLSNTERTRMMAIPEVIYRIIRVRFPLGVVASDYSSDLDKLEWHTTAATVIIHNNLNSGHFQRLCGKENELSGWDKITNEDARTGVTYVCPLTKELGERLGIRKNLTNDKISPLHVDNAPVAVKRYSLDFKDLLDKYRSVLSAYE
ncbi:uncharacterized protein LOC135842637 isoform X1 [Planococcus citri]|uniref:uncharacterized protein LOC135842637 isoform X1 n=1 Tax=Planococcus citri TaxID=170843 RepID=UPI0031F7D7B7